MSRKTTNAPRPSFTRSSRRQQTTIGGLILTVLIALLARWWNSGGTAMLPIATAPAPATVVQLVITPTAQSAAPKPATSNQQSSSAVAARPATVTATTASQVVTATVAPAKKLTATPKPKKQATPTATPRATRQAVVQATRTATTQATATATRRPTATNTPANSTRAGPPGLAAIGEDALPKEARNTLRLIDQAGPFPFDQDGVVFQNRESLLPRQARGYYHEYTVITPGSRDRGARRIVTGDDGEFYYTDDHYDSFYWVERRITLTAMQKLLPLLTGQQAAGVYRLSSAAKAETILAAGQPYGWQAAHLAGDQIASKAALLRACAVAFHFPAYAGHNWDTLEECLRDLSWLPAPGYLLLYDNVSTLARQQPPAWATALAIFHEVARHWQQVQIPFVVLLRHAGRYAAAVEKL